MIQSSEVEYGHEVTAPRAGHTAAAGKRTLTQGLAPRTVVMRMARDASGVADGADAAVDRAASSSGEPLRGDLRERFESSLGADLSSVRIHRSADSAAASAAVGARAYTVGDDIHFAAGQYQPDDPFGLHLIAHEVAHTRQQAGGAPHPQYKLEVSSPGDAAEVDADRAADAMVRGAPASVGAGVAVARQLQREADAGEGESKPKGYRLDGAYLPDKTNVLSGSCQGLYDEVVGTDAFEDVDDGDPLFATLAAFCAPDQWQIPSQSQTQHVSTTSWGRNGNWNVTITPKRYWSVWNGAGTKMTTSSSSQSSTSSGGSTSSGHQVGVEGGTDQAKGSGSASGGSGTSHGGGHSGGSSVQSEAETQKFIALVRFSITIKGGWTDGTALSVGRVLGGIASFGMSEAGRAAGEAIAGVQHTWAGTKLVRYVIEVPTGACVEC